MVDRLAGKRIFITGAAQGIGLAISKACLDEGAHIFMVDLEVDQLKEQVDQLNLGDGRIGWCKADIAEEEGFKAVAVAFRMIAEVEKAHEARYLKLAKNLDDGLVFERDGVIVWKCRNCGFLHEGKKAPKTYRFTRRERR